LIVVKMEVLGGLGKIIKNYDVLSSTYLPEKLPHRDRQIKEMSYYLSFCLRGSTPPHLILEGPTGSGKTAVVKLMLESLQKSTRRTEVLTAYTVASRKSYKNLASLAHSAGCMVSRKGLDFSDAWEWFSGYVGNRILVAVLDEVDKALRTEPSSELLYYLTNRERVCVILVSNQPIMSLIQDLRIRSRLANARFIHFPPYTAPELSDILAERAAKGLAPGSYSRSILDLCGALAMQEGKGDARYALLLLSTSAEIAERKGKRVIEEEDVREADELVRVEWRAAPLLELEPNEQYMMYAIACNEGASHSKIFQFFCQCLERNKLKPPRLTAMRMILYGLEDRGLVETDCRGRGRGKGVEWHIRLSGGLTPEIVLKKLGPILGLEGGP
jgi:cell division control protein 6